MKLNLCLPPSTLQWWAVGGQNFWPHCTLRFLAHPPIPGVSRSLPVSCFIALLRGCWRCVCVCACVRFWRFAYCMHNETPPFKRLSFTLCLWQYWRNLWYPILIKRTCLIACGNLWVCWTLLSYCLLCGFTYGIRVFMFVDCGSS